LIAVASKRSVGLELRFQDRVREQERADSRRRQPRPFAHPLPAGVITRIYRTATAMTGSPSDSGHHQHRGWERFGCRGPVGLRLALAVFYAPALATKGCRIAPTCTCVHFPPHAVRTLALVELCRNGVVARCRGSHVASLRAPSVHNITSDQFQHITNEEFWWDNVHTVGPVGVKSTHYRAVPSLSASSQPADIPELRCHLHGRICGYALL
jgi:hypothetical protein